jgi:thioredoxin-dependent peroxiredoxin
MKTVRWALVGSWLFGCQAQPASVASNVPASPPPSTSQAAPPAAVTASAPNVPAAAGSPADDALVGKLAPDFTATAQDGRSVHLSSLRGKPVVLYFYPKDETPGCTKEACSFRDAWQAIAKTGTTLVGISADSLESHKGFATHYNLPFLLVSDPDGAIAKSYAVPFEGRHRRQTIVVGADGKVRKVYRTVDVASHAQEVLGDLDHAS